MRVLDLVPSADSAAYRGQASALRDRGVDCRTLAVPGTHDPAVGGRSPLDYLVHLGRTVRAATATREPGAGDGDGIGGEVDLVHANQGVVAPAALAAGFAAGLPTVVSLWGTDLYGRLGPVSRRCARRADAVVVMSERMAADLGSDVDARVVPHGVDTDTFRPGDREAARRELGWDDGRAHVLFPYDPARPVKGFPRARRVVAAAGDRLDRGVALDVVTDAPHAAMPTYLVAADALLLVSRHEGSPNSVKEALACGLPVVSTPVGDVPERLAGVSPSAVADGDDALADALGDVLVDGRRSNGPARVASVSRERSARAVASVFREVVAGA